MEEDDLLGQEYKELDPSSKIQRNFSNKHGAYGDRSRFCEEGNRSGGHGGRFNEAYQRRGETRGLIPRDNNYGERAKMGHGESRRFTQQLGEFNKMGWGEAGKGHGGPPRCFEGDIRKREENKGKSLEHNSGKEIRCFRCQEHGHH